jgi:hypothetical protein
LQLRSKPAVLAPQLNYDSSPAISRKPQASPVVAQLEVLGEMMIPLPRLFLFKHCFIPLDLRIKPPPKLLDAPNLPFKLPE